ncbi:class I adenylate-forming enzyme family protein [Mycobacterium sp. Aquia_216]|uniref:class I adenylate-forming enzyme family protein n=1 Tax=Mycobacterium sp. Aquia_216 TaxID=2991729 RepID=UPI00227AF3F8|nr:class I adenylate-forming enzyme family protein [Mycobacterium sp. Aquia_216]WAJ43591.1 class I adenylate-forming enzyme family protein [Mycobacterium sp. Aquia_216]
MNADLRQWFEGIGYPANWLAEADCYAPDDAYVMFDPQWAEPLPPIPEQTVDVVVRRQAAERPDELAIIYLDRSISYGELHELVGRAAAVLRGCGVTRGDVVAVMVPTSAMHWVIFFALARLGAVHCGVNVMYRAEELRFLLDDAAPRVIICLDELLPVIEQAADGRSQTTVFTVSITDLADPEFAPYPGLDAWWPSPGRRPAAAPALLDEMMTAQPLLNPACVADVREQIGQIVYTAGTTGRPKGVLQSHYNLMHNAVTHTLAMPGVSIPVTLSILPLFHTGGFFVYSLPTFVRGGTVIPRPLFDPGDVLRCVQRHSLNVLFGPPTFYVALLKHGLEHTDLSGIRVCSTGAAPIPAALPQRWREATGLQLHGGWGMSELNSLGTFNGLPGKPTHGTLGVPVVGEVRVTVDGCVAAREIEGEIEFRGLQVSKGYLGRPEDTEASFGADGWLRTGDIGYLDQHGALRYVDRKKELLFVSGYNVAPAEIEATLLQHPRITDAAVVGEDDPYRGEIPVAFVVGDVTPDEVESYVREHLAAFKVPRRVEVVDALPKNAMGKTLKQELRARRTEQQ